MLTPSNELFTQRFVVLKDDYGVVIYFTRLELYAGKYTGKARSIEIRTLHELEYICMALNYIMITNYPKYRVNTVCRITSDMIFDFFDFYRSEKKSNEEYRTQQSVNACVSAVTNFMANVTEACGGCAAITLDDIVRVGWTRANAKSKRETKVFLPRYQKKSLQKVVKPILRDMPIAAVNMLIELGFVHAPDIVFAIICEVTAGLRPSEAMNLRRETSPLGPGMSITYQGTKATAVELDLRKEFLLRSDGVRTGGIKKERVQQVYPPFIDLFMKGLRFHEQYQQCKKSEEAFGAMFVNRTGRAMTYKTYQDKFHGLVNEHLRPALLKSSDSALQVLGQRLITQTLSPHALRHCYTVLLVMEGLDIAQIQYYRGDSSPESALWYIQNKGELINAVANAHEKALTSMLGVF